MSLKAAPQEVERRWNAKGFSFLYGRGCPPVTPRISPLTKLDSWEARNTNAGANSAGWAGLPVGEVPPNWETCSAGIEAGSIGVHTGPGATEFTRIPC